MATKKGQVKKTSLEQYSRPRSNGINAITIKENDELLEAKLTDGNSQVMLALKSGKAIRFEEAKTRPMGRNASGVRGIRLQHDNDEVIGMVSVNDMESNILVVSSNGYGKRSRLEDYRITNRGGKGVKTISITEKTGDLVAIKNVDDTNGLMIINKSGIAIRMAVKNLRVMGRATQGVKLINLKESDSIAAVAKVVHDEDEEKDNDDSSIETVNLTEDMFSEMQAREQFILTLTENGFGKRTSSYQFRITNRGGSGIKCITTSERNGNVLASFQIENADDIMLITKSGQLIRCPGKDIRVAGRNTQGVSIFKTSDKEKVVSASRVEIEAE